MGLVPEVFNESILNGLHGHIAIGHVRYSTTGSSVVKNAQPFVVSHGGKPLAIAHNGNLTNARKLREDLEKRGSIFQTTMDSEIIVHLLARNMRDGVEEAMVKAVSEIQGAYCCVLMTEDRFMAFRDPNGFRPFCLGTLNGGYIIASETCALDLIDAQYVRDIEPGEILIISREGLSSIKPFAERRKTLCIFEFIYFARPDSNIFGQNVYAVRKRLGRKVAKEYPVEADFAMPFPDSGNYAAIGFCHESDIPLEMGVIRNHYVGRTFIIIFNTPSACGGVKSGDICRDYGIR